MPRRKRIAGSATEVSDFDAKCLCGNCAVAYLEIHAVDYCTPDSQTLTSLKCKACLVSDLTKMIDILFDHVPLWCSSCGEIIVALSDLVIRIQPLSTMV